MQKLLLIPLILLPLFLQAQKAPRMVYVGVSANAYKGDLQNSYEKYTSIFHVGLKLNKKKRLNGNIGLGYGNINGQSINPRFKTSENTVSPNRYFKTSIFTVHYNIQYNFIKNDHWIVYLSQAIGIIRFNPKDKFNVNLQDQLSTRASNETYGNTSLMLPTKVGFIYLFDNEFGAGFEAGFLNTLTDYLDNISQMGTKDGNDNLLQFKFSFYVPLGVEN